MPEKLAHLDLEVNLFEVQRREKAPAKTQEARKQRNLATVQGSAEHYLLPEPLRWPLFLISFPSVIMYSFSTSCGLSPGLSGVQPFRQGVFTLGDEAKWPFSKHDLDTGDFKNSRKVKSHPATCYLFLLLLLLLLAVFSLIQALEFVIPFHP